MTKLPKIPGPTGKFRPSGPINDDDRGGVFAAMRPATYQGHKVIELNFGTTVDWLASSPDEATQMAASFRKNVRKWYGILSYNATTFPMKVIANKDRNVIETKLTESTNTIIANPEFYLG